MNLKEKLKKNNLNTKLISLVMAILLWSYIMGIENPESERPYRGVDVNITGEHYLQQEGYSLISPQDPKITVDIVGTRSNFIDFSSANILAELNLEGMKPGDNKAEINVSIVRHSGDVTISGWEPSSVIVTLDEIVTENIRINVQTLGELEESYTLGNVRVLNNYVRITAPKSVIDQIKNAITYVDVTGRRDTFMVNSPIVLLDKNDNEIKNLDMSIEYTDIEVPIYKQKSVPIEVNLVGNIGEDEKITNVQVVPENVVIRGQSDIIDGINSIQTEPVERRDLLGSQTQEVTLVLPNGVALHNNDLDVHLEYDYLNYIEKVITIPRDNFNINNENLEYDYEINSDIENISIIIYGESNDVGEINSEEIQIYIDVKDLSPGKYAIEPKIYNINDLTIRNIEPSTIEVEIKD